MKIAVPYADGCIFPHFGKTEQFKFYETENGRILSEEIVPTNGKGHGALAGFLADAQVELLLCGGIGAGAREALAAEKIRVLGGVTEKADDAVRAYLAGTLAYDPDAHCRHHDGGAGHVCETPAKDVSSCGNSGGCGSGHACHKT